MRLLMRSRMLSFVVLAAGVAGGVAVYFLHNSNFGPVPTDQWHAGTTAPLRVMARGSGRAWRFAYSGPDGILGSSDDLVCEDRLTLPAGADVVLQLRSDDYIYVFSCPRLQLKEIAVPDLAFSLAFHTGHRGEYDLVMDPMCGFRLPPGQTMGTIRIVSGRDFRSWLGGGPRS